MNTHSLDGNLPSYRIPCGTCVEDIDGGQLIITLGAPPVEYRLPILKGARAVEEAQASIVGQEGATFWTQLDAVKAAIHAVGGPECDEDLADSIKHRLLTAFSKKKAGQRSDFDELSKPPRSTDTGSED